MWPLTKKLNKEAFLDLKSVKINGFKFKIKKINPFLDFEGDELPELFTIYQKPKKENLNINYDYQIKKFKEEIKSVIKAGTYDPNLKDNDINLTVDDIFRDPDVAFKLYSEIVAHSLKKYSGIRGLFFYLKIRLSLFIHWRKNMDVIRQTLYFTMEKQA